MASVTLTWKTMMDDKVCPTCQALEGYVWAFSIGVDTFPQLLEANGMTVWDVNEGSRAHGHRGNCRCTIKVDLDLRDILERLETFYQHLLARRGESLSAK